MPNLISRGTSYSQHENLNTIKHIVAIGGGHGLGRVMSALGFMNERLTGIVTTTDNGGSTGRIRQEQGGIAWGDLRNCLNQIITTPTTASALFEYRFSGTGGLAGHNLGNLMLKALENRINWIHQIIGKEIIDGIITQYDPNLEIKIANSAIKIMAKRLKADDISYRHDRTLLCKAIDELLDELLEKESDTLEYTGMEITN